MSITVTFTQNIQRHVKLPPRQVTGATVREALEAVFAEQPVARSYIVDERGCLRTHMNVFVNGEPIEDREGLTDRLPDGADVYVMQALSGG